MESTISALRTGLHSPLGFVLIECLIVQCGVSSFGSRSREHRLIRWIQFVELFLIGGVSADFATFSNISDSFAETKMDALRRADANVAHAANRWQHFKWKLRHPFHNQKWKLRGRLNHYNPFYYLGRIAHNIKYMFTGRR